MGAALGLDQNPFGVIGEGRRVRSLPERQRMSQSGSRGEVIGKVGLGEAASNTSQAGAGYATGAEESRGANASGAGDGRGVEDREDEAEVLQEYQEEDADTEQADMYG